MILLALLLAEAWARAGKGQPKTMSEWVAIYRVTGGPIVTFRPGLNLCVLVPQVVRSVGQASYEEFRDVQQPFRHNAKSGAIYRPKAVVTCLLQDECSDAHVIYKMLARSEGQSSGYVTFQV